MNIPTEYNEIKALAIEKGYKWTKKTKVLLVEFLSWLEVADKTPDIGNTDTSDTTDADTETDTDTDTDTTDDGKTPELELVKETTKPKSKTETKDKSVTKIKLLRDILFWTWLKKKWVELELTKEELNTIPEKWYK